MVFPYYIIGNWKSNKNEAEVTSWFSAFAKEYEKRKQLLPQELTIVVCPPFPYLALAQKMCRKLKLPIKIGAQDVSPFGNGAYTGAVSASMVSDFAEFVLIGHSERRNYFHEDNHVLQTKVKQAKDNNLKVIYCIPDEKTAVPEGVSLIAYEPIWAIGTGKTDTPENANEVALHIKEKTKYSTVIYGGSVKPENVAGFANQEHLSGVLPGGASLEPVSFWQMIVNAIST